MEGFQQLDATELSALLDAPVLITILIGAADGDLDREERTWSDRLMRVRTYSNARHLHEFYETVANGFLDKVDAHLAALPETTQTRNEMISGKLSDLNAVLAKLEHSLAADLYNGFLGLAEETAEASGGFLRMGAVSAAEDKWVKLEMLTPIAG
jgi:hypothetical protein